MELVLAALLLASLIFAARIDHERQALLATPCHVTVFPR
jgi:hypothetical protein